MRLQLWSPLCLGVGSPLSVQGTQQKEQGPRLTPAQRMARGVSRGLMLRGALAEAGSTQDD